MQERTTVTKHRTRLQSIGLRFALVSLALLLLVPLAHGQTKLTVGTWLSPADWENSYSAQMQALREAMPDLELEIIQIAAHGEYAGKLLLLAATGQIPDILHIPPEQVAPLTGALGILEDLQTWIDNDPTFDTSAFLPPVLEAMRFNDITFGMPAYVVNYAYAYNPDILAERGVVAPAATDWPTWDQIREIARRTTYDTDGDGTPDVWGYFNAFGFDFMLPLIYQAGGEVYDENMKITLNTPEVKEAFTWLYEMAVEEEIHPPTSVPRTMFYNGQIATMRLGSYEFNNLVSSNVPVVVAAGGQHRVKSEVAYVTTFAMNAASRQKEAVWEFLKWIASVESQNYVALRGRVPIRHDVDLPPETQHILSGLILALGHARTYPYHIESDAITRMFNQATPPIFTGEVAIESVLVELERTINAYLE